MKLLKNKNKPLKSIFRSLLKHRIEDADHVEFFSEVYISDDKIDKKAEQFLNSLEDSDCPFQLLHGYAKNGKSTFIQYIRYLYNQMQPDERKFRYVIEVFNFERGGLTSFSKKGEPLSFYDKAKFLFMNQFSCTDGPSLTEILMDLEQFSIFYRNFLAEISNTPDRAATPAVGNLNGFCSNLFMGLDYVCSQTSNGTVGEYSKNLSLFKEHVFDKMNQNNCGYYFAFLILYNIFSQRRKLLKKDRQPGKLIFVLDNLDDYLTDKDIHFFQQPQFQLSRILTSLMEYDFISEAFSNCLKVTMDKSETVDWDLSFYEQLKIIYVFRTSNFLVFSHLMMKLMSKVSESSEKYFPIGILTRHYVGFQSVRSTNKILGRRVQLLEDVADDRGTVLPPGFHLMKALAHYSRAPEGRETHDHLDNLFSIWNGDLHSIVTSFLNYGDLIKADFLTHESLVKKAMESKFYAKGYLLKGVLIYFLLKLHDYNPRLKGFLETIYNYRASHARAKKSLRRFVTNYIINKSEEHGKPRTISGIVEGGVGLFDLLTAINSFINSVNARAKEEEKEPVFSMGGVKKFFADSYNHKIDHSAHLFTIYKSQIEENAEGEEFSSIYYRLDDEIDNFIEDKSPGKANSRGLNDIRIFNNHSAAFLSSYLMTHFELQSFCESHGVEPSLQIKRPLLMALARKQGISVASRIEDFEFHDIVESVFASAVISVNALVDFYLRYLIDEFPPHEFVKKPLFSVRRKQTGDFQFRLMISRHIRYVEGFRQGILSGGLIALEEDEKVMINLYLVGKVREYIDLFDEKVSQIEERLKYRIQSGSLWRTCRANNEFRGLTDEILATGGKDFETIIRTTEEGPGDSQKWKQ